MYSSRPGLVLGFHGCDETVRDAVVSGKIQLKDSVKDHEWLGHGIYFWENSPSRALQYGRQLAKSPRSGGPQIKNPSVLGAVIDLGLCLDLLDHQNLIYVKDAFEILKSAYAKSEFDLPQNKAPKNSSEALIRKLDCAVLNTLHKARANEGLDPFDSVRGIFLEGNALYPQAGFREKDHIQICITNPNSIKGYFIPRKLSSKYKNV